MKNIFIICFLGGLFFLITRNISAQNTISGIVFDESRKPVGKIDVELLDEFERLLKTTKTSTSGLYFFQALRAGIYFVQVRTDGTGYKAVKERIQLGQTNRTSITGQSSGSESLQVNFTLEINRPGNQSPLNNDVIFAQSVPPEAEKYFESALKKLKDRKTDEAIAELENALKIFPEYFLALEKIGYEHLAKAKFPEAESAFGKALEVNPKSFSAKSGLGIAEYKLGKVREAAKTLEESIALNQSAANSFLFLGKIYRELKQFEKAEASLKRAKELSKNKLADVHWELALLYYYNLNRPGEAAEELELYLRAKPDAANKSQVEKLIKTIRGKVREKS
jgi:predicted Zn-dependent protease